MAKQTKTFKIGESCQGGIITAEINGTTLKLIGKEWDRSAGTNKGSDQSKAKAFTSTEIEMNPHDQVYRMAYEFLTELTTHYYAETIIEWVESKAGRLNRGFGGW